MIIPDNILKLMDPKDRPKGAAGQTWAEANTHGIARSEREEQRLFYNWLLPFENNREIIFDWSRTDKPTTRRLGALDFVIYHKMGQTLFLEFKLKGSGLRPEQERQVEILTDLGFMVAIPQNAGQAIAITRKWFLQANLP
jgi:hypothetical protein